MTDWNQKKYEYALKIGYIDTDDPQYEHTFVGAFIKKYPNNIRVIHEMKSSVGRLPVWEDITDRMLRELKDALECDTTSNTRRTYYASIKSILNSYKGEANFPSTKYAEILKSKNEPSQNVFLTEEEISRIYDYSPKNDEEKFVRKVFLISCYTGCRHSDATSISLENINEKWLTYVSGKTKTESRLPAHKNLPSLISEDVYVQMNDLDFNYTIREICKECDISGKIKLFRRGGIEVREKYEFVASHTARRSFCTNLYLRGADILSISKMAGHSSQEMTRRYIVGYKEQSQEILDFFQS